MATTMERLSFLRWLAEAGQLEHETAGPSCGELAASVDTITARDGRTVLVCSADRSNVELGPLRQKAACPCGHRWLREGSGWRQVR